MTAEPRLIVLDANILIRMVLGVRVRELILHHAEATTFFTPLECYEDARRYLPGLLARRGVAPEAALAVLEGFTPFVQPLEESSYEAFRELALARIARRDERDWPILAAALALGCPIWTEDQDLFGTGVATWTTDRVELYLKGTDELPPPA